MRLGTGSTFCYSSGVVRFLPYMHEMTKNASLLYILTINESYQTAVENFFAPFRVTLPLVISPSPGASLRYPEPTPRPHGARMGLLFHAVLHISSLSP